MVRLNSYRLVLFIAMALKVCAVKAQDTIYFTNNKQMGVKVIEVTAEQIKYKRFDNQEGAAYTASVNDILKIKYKSGSIDTFDHKDVIKSDTSAIEKQQPRDKKFDINDSETTAMVERIATFVGDKVLHSCAYNPDNSAIAVYYDQVYKDALSGEINIPIIVKWDRGSTDYWIKGTIKVSSEGKKSWSYTDNSGGIYSGCAQNIKDL